MVFRLDLPDLSNSIFKSYLSSTRGLETNFMTDNVVS